MVQSQYMDLNGYRLHYYQGGSGHPLLLLHGTALDSAYLTYGIHLEALAQHFNVVALDFPGYGESSDQQKRYSIRHYQELLPEFIAALGLQGTHVIAFSMGVAVVLGVALQHPELFSKHIWVDGYGLYPSIHIPFLPKLLLSIPNLPHTLWQKVAASPKALAWILRLMVVKNFSIVDAALLTHLQKAMYNSDVLLTWLQQEVGYRRYNTVYSGDISRIANDVLLIHGNDDRITPVSRSEYAAKHLPHAQLKRIANSGHWVTREQPEIWLGTVLEFLRSEPRSNSC